MPYQQYPKIKEDLERMIEYIEYIIVPNSLGTYYTRLGDLNDKKTTKKLNNAIKSYAKDMQEDEDLLFFIDDTLFGSATEGAIFTNKKIYSKFFLKEPKSVNYIDIENIKIEKFTDEKNRIIINNEIVIIVHTTISFLFLVKFISDYSNILKLSLSGEIKELSEEEIDNILFEAYLFGVEREKIKENEEESGALKFFSNHKEEILKVLSDYGIPLVKDKLLTEKNIREVVRIIYNVLPAPLRLLVKEETIYNFIVNNKDTVINKLIGS